MGTPGVDNIRMHSEAPAEGDNSREFPEIRAHSQDPAEGPDDTMEASPIKPRRASPGPTDQTPNARTIQTMTGTFELLATTGGYEFRLLSSTGKVIAVSGAYRDKKSAVEAIRDARECAAMALIKDHSSRQLALPPTQQPHKGPSRWFG
jgi:uncharacterized protein YegP (UPF0339 family)